MSIATLENEIVWALRLRTQNTKITRKWIREWSTSKIENLDGETLIELTEPGLHIWVAIQDPKTLKIR